MNSSHDNTEKKHNHVERNRLTSLTGTAPETRAGAVADVAVPSFFTCAAVLARVAVTLFARRLSTRRPYSCHVLGLSYLPDVFASAVDEQISDAAHVTIVKYGGPKLSGEHQNPTTVRQAPQIKVALQVQDLIFPVCGEWRPTTVYWDDAWKRKIKCCMNMTYDVT